MCIRCCRGECRTRLTVAVAEEIVGRSAGLRSCVTDGFRHAQQAAAAAWIVGRSGAQELVRNAVAGRRHRRQRRSAIAQRQHLGRRGRDQVGAGNLALWNRCAGYAWSKTCRTDQRRTGRCNVGGRLHTVRCKRGAGGAEKNSVARRASTAGSNGAPEASGTPTGWPDGNEGGGESRLTSRLIYRCRDSRGTCRFRHRRAPPAHRWSTPRASNTAKSGTTKSHGC